MRRRQYSARTQPPGESGSDACEQDYAHREDHLRRIALGKNIDVSGIIHDPDVLPDHAVVGCAGFRLNPGSVAPSAQLIIVSPDQGHQANSVDLGDNGS